MIIVINAKKASTVSYGNYHCFMHVLLLKQYIRSFLIHPVQCVRKKLETIYS